jgi:hypothetical protein
MSSNIPTLVELHMDPEAAFANDKFLMLLNQPPHEKWIKKHPTFKSKYLPIDKVEYLLKRIFQKYRIEILREGLMLNAAYVVVRVHYLHPQSGEWSYHDGIGAKGFQLDSGSSASDLTAIKAEAVMIALPTAKSLAIKDACDHLGKLFGGDLNRKDTLRFKGGYILTDQEEPTEEEKNGDDEPLPWEENVRKAPVKKQIQEPVNQQDGYDLDLPL